MSDPEFRIVRTFRAPRPLVWQAWTDPALLTEWFGPKGTRMELLKHDFRPGGILHSRLTSADGPGMYAKFVYREIEPPVRLSWVHSFADADANIVPSPFGGEWPLELLTNVTFEEAGDDTRVTLTWVPIDATEAQRAEFAANFDSMTGGWSGSYDRLDAYLAD